MSWTGVGDMETTPMIDLDSMIWARRLILSGVILMFSYVGTLHSEFKIGDLGFVLILGGLFFIFDFQIKRPYKPLMLILIVLTLMKIASVVASYINQPESESPFLQGLNVAGELIGPIGLPVFAHAMRLMSLEYNLSTAADSWKTSIRLAIFMYWIPITLGWLAYLGFVITGTKIDFNVSNHSSQGNIVGFLAVFVGVFLLFALVGVPVVSAIVSFNKTIREAKSLAEGMQPYGVAT